MPDAPLDFYAQRRALTHEDRWDTSPSRKPYPDAGPTFATRHQDPTVRDVHAVALHTVQRIAHEKAVLVDAGETSQLGQLKRAIQEGQSLQEELGIGVVTIAPQTQAYLDMEEPGKDGDDPKLTDVGY